MAGKDVPVSPLAPKKNPKLPALDGVTFATAEAGIRYRNRTDVLLVTMPAGTAVAGVFTKSKCPSAPVDWCRDNLVGGTARALVVNSGNANAFTGLKGREAVQLTADIAAKELGVKPSEIFLASTGVIGEPLDGSKFTGVIGECARRAEGTRWLDAAKAIMTTDTFPKIATRKAKVDGVEVILNGMAKGAGMIAPDMATMLGFVFTDAALSPGVLRSLLSLHVRSTFNSVTVDGDTSTNDTCLLIATGQSGAPRIGRVGDRRLADFSAKLEKVLLSLAHQLVRDGEGATKFVKVQVSGAASPASARRIAKSIAESPLVKTAIAGEDANWGRIVMAVGKTEEPVSRDRLAIKFGPHQAAIDGAPAPTYDEAKMSAYMKRSELEISVDVGVGRGHAAVWTCDLTKGYIEINGDYRS